MLMRWMRDPTQVEKEAFLKAVGLQGNPWGQPTLETLPNLKSTTESEFWGWRASQGFPGDIWAGSIKLPTGGWGTLLLYWLNCASFMDGGFAVVVSHGEYDKETKDYVRKVSYYSWKACEHEFTERTTGNCLHLYTCKKCKRAYEVDSSG